MATPAQPESQTGWTMLQHYNERRWPAENLTIHRALMSANSEHPNRDYLVGLKTQSHLRVDKPMYQPRRNQHDHRLRPRRAHCRSRRSRSRYSPISHVPVIIKPPHFSTLFAPLASVRFGQLGGFSESLTGDIRYVYRMQAVTWSAFRLIFSFAPFQVGV